MNDHKQNMEPWDQDSYATGSTQPPKTRRGLVTGLLVAVIFLGGIASALFFMGSSEGYSIAAWASGFFVTAIPGIVTHLILVPALALTLTKAGVVPKRY